jgi:hypothetical protein
LAPAEGERGLRVLDGRNRIAAIFRIVDPKRREELDQSLNEAGKGCIIYGVMEDPLAYVISANIHRRHLTAAQKRDVIAALLKANPERSDRSIAKEIGASPTTVGAVREQGEKAGAVSKVDTRTGRDGRTTRLAKTPAQMRRERTELDQKIRMLDEPKPAPAPDAKTWTDQADKVTAPTPAAASAKPSRFDDGFDPDAEPWQNYKGADPVTISQRHIAFLNRSSSRLTDTPIVDRVALVRGFMLAWGVAIEDIAAAEPASDDMEQRFREQMAQPFVAANQEE